MSDEEFTLEEALEGDRRAGNDITPDTGDGSETTDVVESEAETTGEETAKAEPDAPPASETSDNGDEIAGLKRAIAEVRDNSRGLKDENERLRRQLEESSKPPPPDVFDGRDALEDGEGYTQAVKQHTESTVNKAVLQTELRMARRLSPDFEAKYQRVNQEFQRDQSLVAQAQAYPDGLVSFVFDKGADLLKADEAGNEVETLRKELADLKAQMGGGEKPRSSGNAALEPSLVTEGTGGQPEPGPMSLEDAFGGPDPSRR